MWVLGSIQRWSMQPTVMLGCECSCLVTSCNDVMITVTVSSQSMPQPRSCLVPYQHIVCAACIHTANTVLAEMEQAEARWYIRTSFKPKYGTHLAQGQIQVCVRHLLHASAIHIPDAGLGGTRAQTIAHDTAASPTEKGIISICW